MTFCNRLIKRWLESTYKVEKPNRTIRMEGKGTEIESTEPGVTLLQYKKVSD